MKSRVVMLVFVLNVVLMPHGTAIEAQSSPQTETMDCILVPFGEIEGETMVCGRIQVPMDQDDPESRLVDIAYVILYSTGDHPNAVPILKIGGGPGGGQLHPAYIATIWRFASRLRETHDIIIYDQRGVGASYPTFGCAYIFHDADGQRDCAEEMSEQDIDPTNYSTAINANDAMTLMRALDYEGYHLFGTSYGTRVAMMIMHRYPDNSLIQTVTLNSIYPLPEDRFFVYVDEETEVLETVFKLCDEDVACHEAYPDLSERFDMALERIEAGEFGNLDLVDILFPFHSTIYVPFHMQFQPRMIVELSEGITDTLNATSQSTAFPFPDRSRMLDFRDIITSDHDCIATYEVDYETAVQATRLMSGKPDDLVAFVDVICEGDVQKQLHQEAANMRSLWVHQVGIDYLRLYGQTIRPQLFERNLWLNVWINCTETYPFLPPSISIGLVDICEGPLLGNGHLAQPTEATFGDYPTLVLHGELDFNALVRFAEAVPELMPQAQIVIFPGTGHDLLVTRPDCTTDIMLDFLADPMAAPDASCREEFAIQFVMPDDPLPLIE